MMRMKQVYLLLLLSLSVIKCQTRNASAKLVCLTNGNCGYPNGQCLVNECVCAKGWIIVNQTGCTYQLKSKLTAFLLSFFVGVFGVDWFYLCLGNAGYIIAGVIKLLTFGGFGVWWLVDWIRILVNAFHDGNGMPLRDWYN